MYEAYKFIATGDVSAYVGMNIRGATDRSTYRIIVVCDGNIGYIELFNLHPGEEVSDVSILSLPIYLLDTVKLN